jgi:hypothetical protein
MMSRRRNEKLWAEFIAAIDAMNLSGPYFVEERVTRQRGHFLRAVKDVPAGESWWEIRFFFTQTESCWAFLPENRHTSEFAWGNTLHQAYLNGILQQVGS